MNTLTYTTRHLLLQNLYARDQAASVARMKAATELGRAALDIAKWETNLVRTGEHGSLIYEQNRYAVVVMHPSELDDLKAQITKSREEGYMAGVEAERARIVERITGT